MTKQNSVVHLCSTQKLHLCLFHNKVTMSNDGPLPHTITVTRPGRLCTPP
jgi:hypothetical protein